MFGSGVSDTIAAGRAASEGDYGGASGRGNARGERVVLDVSFLGGVDARKGRWRDTAAEAKGISTSYYWTGKGRDALEVAYGTTVTKPNASTVREVWMQRHGRAAAPLLVVVAYPKDRLDRALVCGPAGEDPPVVELDHAHAERLAVTALDEPSRHPAIRFLADALEGDPDENPGLRNKGLLATHELLYGVPRRSDWEDATERSRPLLGLRDQDLVQGLGYEIEPRGRVNVLRASGGERRRSRYSCRIRSRPTSLHPASRTRPLSLTRLPRLTATTCLGWWPCAAARSDSILPRRRVRLASVAGPRRSSD